MKAVILAGGSGTRLWPVSRYGLPKQFIKLGSGKSLLVQTVERLAAVVPLGDIYVITNEDYHFHVQADLRSVSPSIAGNIILEPVGRNTAPAIALVLKYCQEKLGCGRDEVVFVCPSDHIIEPVEKFAHYAEQAADAARGGKIVTFGVNPSRPETGYGYIKKGKRTGAREGVYDVARFAEKPDLPTAEKYLEAGGYYWNSGMFAFTISTMLSEFRAYAPEISRRLAQPLARLVAGFGAMPSISIDYAVMERSRKAAVLPMDLVWSDVGSWDQLPEVVAPDAGGNVYVGDVMELDTRATIIYGGKRLISAVGVKDLIIVDTEDALLVMKRGQAQRVKEVVEKLRERGRKEAEEHITAYRPWGSYVVLEEGPRYKIKRVVLLPGHKLSPQLHYRRSEHWVVLKGCATVTIGGKTSLVRENESTYVPKATSHRLENAGKVPLEIIEVENGEYVGEDDIVRLEAGSRAPSARVRGGRK